MKNPIEMKTKVKMTHCAVASIAAAASLVSADAATLIFSEDFNGVPVGTPVTGTSSPVETPPVPVNTAFDVVRDNDNSSVRIVGIASTVGTGTSARFTSNNSQATGAFAGETGLGALTTMSVAFSISMETMTSGSVAIWAGNGGTVTNAGNNGKNTSQLLWDVLINADGTLGYRAGSVQTVNGFTVEDDTAYDFLIQVNNTGSAVEGVAANSMSIYVNGALVGSGLALQGNNGGSGNATALRMGALDSNGGIVAEVDNVQIWNGIQVIPEPSSLLMGAFGSLLLLRRRR